MKGNSSDEAKNFAELSEKWGFVFNGTIVNSEYNWCDLEMILPGKIDGGRIIRIIKDREQAPTETKTAAQNGLAGYE